MSATRFLLPVLVFLSACQERSPSDQPLDPSQEERLAAEIRGTVADLTDAMNSGDPDAVLGFYRDTEDFVYVGCTDLMFGSDFFKALVGPYYVNNPGMGFVRDILEIQVMDATSAVVTLRGSSSRSRALFWTQVLTREGDGRWLITHEHESWPGCEDPPAPHPTGAMGDTAGSLESDGGSQEG